MSATSLSYTLRRARVGDLLPGLVERASVRGNEATCIVLPGTAGPLDDYLRGLNAARDEFALWDGRVVALAADGSPPHRVTILDRYGQVYAVIDAEDVAGLPDVAALEEWFRFLATACPECGVLDDPIGRGWVP